MPTPGDTGWLKPRSTSILNQPGDTGQEWWGLPYSANFDNQATTVFVTRFVKNNSPDFYETQRIKWNWVLPSGIYDARSEVVGIEARVWVRHDDAPSGGGPPGPHDVHLHYLEFGDAVVFSNDSSVSSEIPYNDDTHIGAGMPTQKIDIGGATSLFGLPANTLVSDFLAQDALGSKHAYLRAACLTGGPVTAYIYLSNMELKVHWEIPDVIIDFGAQTIDVAATLDPAPDVYAVKDLGADIEFTVGADSANLSGDIMLGTGVPVEVTVPADITKGPGAYIDSTAFPTVVISIVDPDLLVTHNLEANVTLQIEALDFPIHHLIEMESLIQVLMDIDTDIDGYKELGTDPIADSIVISLIPDPDPGEGFVAVKNMIAEIPVALTMTPALEGTINFAECDGDFCIDVQISIITDVIRYVALDSCIKVIITIEEPGVEDVMAMAANPEVVLAISEPEVFNLYDEPSCNIIKLCPPNRTIKLLCPHKDL